MRTVCIVLLCTLCCRSMAESDAGDYWVKRLRGHLMPVPSITNTVTAGRITALYMTASWCGPCQQFSPELVKFRDRNADKFQFVMISYDRSLDEQLKCLAHLQAPAVRFDSKERDTLTTDSVSDGIPQLLVYSPAGRLITHEGRTLIEQGGELEDFGDATVPGFELRRTILQPWVDARNAASKDQTGARAKRLAELKEEYGKNPFWPLYEASVLDGTEQWFEESANLAALTKVGNEIARRKAWGDLWMAARLISHGNPDTGELHPGHYWGSLPMFRAAGKAAAGDKGFRDSVAAITCQEGGADYVYDLMLGTLAAAAATGKDKADADLFWKEAAGILAEQNNFHLLVPLLVSGEPKAYAIVTKAAEEPGLSGLVANALKPAADAGNAQAKALLRKLEK